MTVYYIPPYDGVSNVTAFKPVSPYFDSSYQQEIIIDLHEPKLYR
jgi:hypothetical protein